MSLAWPFKDPNEVLDYAIDWTARLPGGDTLTNSTWSIVESNPVLTIDNQSMDPAGLTVVWLGSGAVGVTYHLLNRVTTLGGRTMDQTVKLKIKEK